MDRISHEQQWSCFTTEVVWETKIIKYHISTYLQDCPELSVDQYTSVISSDTGVPKKGV